MYIYYFIDIIFLYYFLRLNEQYEMLTYFYLRPWTRVPPYLIGMGTCLLLTKWNYKLHLSKVYIYIYNLY